jgi:hypothetical protein
LVQRYGWVVCRNYKFHRMAQQSMLTVTASDVAAALYVYLTSTS